jgi:hypothetical protein
LARRVADRPGVRPYRMFSKRATPGQAKNASPHMVGVKSANTFLLFTEATSR